MQFLELAKARYTTKKYDPTKKIPEATLEELKEILQLSPSSINSQPWKFVFVGDEALKRQLAAASYFNEEKINQASQLVVFSSLDDIPQFERQINKHLPEGSLWYYNHFLKPTSDQEIKAWMKNQVYLSLGFFLSAAAHLGVDSSPMEGIQPAAYKAILGLENHEPLFAVALGYRHPQDQNHPTQTAKSRLPVPEIITTF